jgi:hypothetical protein
MSSARSTTRAHRNSERSILRDCTALGGLAAPRQPARERLDEALGPVLAGRLVSSLSLTRRTSRA